MIERCTLADVFAGRCSAGCGRDARATGRCWGCYSRYRRITRTVVCRIPDCDRQVECRQLCLRHYERWREHGDPLVLLVPAPVVRYAQAHGRVARERGSARDHTCVDCGHPALDWSYVGGDPNELVGRSPYSLDVSRYVPRCRSCHVRRDRRRRKEAAA